LTLLLKKRFFCHKKSFNNYYRWFYHSVQRKKQITPSKSATEIDCWIAAKHIYIIKGNVPAEKQSTTFFWEEIF
jgi:hypothetical protein